LISRGKSFTSDPSMCNYTSIRTGISKRKKEKGERPPGDQGGSKSSFLRALALAKLHSRASSWIQAMISWKVADF
jgi:hypothetical protein